MLYTIVSCLELCYIGLETWSETETKDLFSSRSDLFLLENRLFQKYVKPFHGGIDKV